MSNAQRTRLAVAAFACTLAGCVLGGCSHRQAVTPWRVEKGSEWTWDKTAGGGRWYTVTAKVLEASEYIKLAITRREGKWISEEVVDVHESAVPAAVVAEEGHGVAPNEKIEWIRLPDHVLEQGVDEGRTIRMYKAKWGESSLSLSIPADGAEHPCIVLEIYQTLALGPIMLTPIQKP